MKRLIYVILLTLSLLSCNRYIIDPNSLDTDEGIVVGRINVIFNGEKINECCEIVFHDEDSSYPYMLDESGMVVLKMKKGNIGITGVVQNTISGRPNYVLEGSSFRNYGGGRLSYFGDVTFLWQYECGLWCRFKNMLLFSRFWFDDENDGEITMTVKNNKSATLAEYQELTGNSIKNVVTSLVKVGR